jgi:LmbE family N-acetylglucosaminyl deacetylase
MTIVVVAPHPDDEVLGVGGTILRRVSEGHEVVWLIVTKISEEGGWSKKKIESRSLEIKHIAEFLGVSEVVHLGFEATTLDSVPMSELVSKFGATFNNIQPEEIFIPHPSDVHTEHGIVFRAAVSCTKWFRYPSIKRVLAYETLSETNFGLDPSQNFRPNVYINISDYIEEKQQAMAIYGSELGVFPFPRSLETIKSLASLRGSSSGYQSAEAFELLLERS